MNMQIDAGLAMTIAAFLALLSAVIVALINNKSQNNKVISEISRQYSLIVYRLEQVEQKVTDYNNFESRLVALNERYSALEELVKTTLKHMEGPPK